MQCPYCRQEMEKGFIRCRNGVFRITDIQRLSETEEQHCFDKVYAHKCNGCKKMIIEYDLSEEQEKNPDDVDLLIDYMQENINRFVSINELAEFSKVNRVTVNRMFRKKLNTTPIEYFINLKTEYAKKYLQDGHYNVSQVAEMLGYANVHYFSRQFKKVVGMAPTEYILLCKTNLPG